MRQHNIQRSYGHRRQKVWWNSCCICHLKVCGRGSCGRVVKCVATIVFNVTKPDPLAARTNLQVVKSVENTSSLISCIQIDCETTLWLNHWKTRKSSNLRCNNYDTCVVQSKRVILMIWVDALITLQEQGTWDVFRIKLGGKIFRKKSSCFEIDDRSDVNGTP